MSGFWSVRRVMFGAIFTAAVAGGAIWAQTGGATAAPATQAQSNDYVIMKIGGKDISAAMFNSILYNVAGPRVFDEVFNLTVVQQMCINSGIPMDNASYGNRVQTEIDRTLMSLPLPETPATSTKPAMAPGTAMAATGASKMSEEERNQRSAVLGQILAKNNMTWIEWRMNVETAAGLRELANGKIPKTTVEEARTAWMADFGERRNV
ncbi:MAG TPA: hypothetical protein VHM90_01770, partial [Phycisphaerae bacterium]|nr:hypothetical protein [Phycisphaerae bacterium]